MYVLALVITLLLFAALTCLLFLIGLFQGRLARWSASKAVRTFRQTFFE